MKRLTKRNESNTAYYYPHCFREDTCMGMGYSTKCDECDFIDMVCEKLGEYEDAEEQGLLLKLPVAEGANVFCIGGCGEICNDYETDCKDCKCGKHEVVFCTNFDRNMVEQFGKTVFLTEEEAEQALRKMKGGAE